MGDRTLPMWLRLILLATAAAQIVFGLTLLINPGAISDLWPWTLTPITTRLLGASALVSIPLSVLSAIANRYSAVRIPMIMSLIYRVFQVVAGLTGLSRFDFSKLVTWNYFGGGILMLVVFAYAWWFGPQLGQEAEGSPRWLGGAGPLSLGKSGRLAVRLIALLYFGLGVALLVLGPEARWLWFEAPGQLTPLTARLFSGPIIGLSVGLWLMTQAQARSETTVPAAGMVTIGLASGLALLLERASVAPSSPLGWLSATAPVVLALAGVYLLLGGRRAAGK